MPSTLSFSVSAAHACGGAVHALKTVPRPAGADAGPPTQTWGATATEMVNNGLRLAGIGPEITVKVPITRIGIEAASDLTAESVATTMTGIHCPHQAFTAMAMGADYAAPYLGRMNDAGRDGFGAIEAMLRMTTASESAMRILVASVRSVASAMSWYD